MLLQWAAQVDLEVRVPMQTDTNASRPDSEQYSASKCIKITSPASCVSVTYKIKQSDALQLFVAAEAVITACAVGLQTDCMVAVPAPVVRLPDSHA